MRRINRDTGVAIFLLLVCGAFFWASFDIRDMGYESLGSEVWPRMVLTIMSALCFLYLVRSLAMGQEAGDVATGVGVKGAGRVKTWYATYRNAIWCFVTFGVFLVTLPYLGMLIGGVLFVFVALTVLGGWDAKSLVIHGAIALLTVSAVWALFTFGLRVILPEGEIFTVI
ncbi:MAG: tripartite tricarboxylate transporter TctB family protein [Alphaproteobacteria bacterium]